MSESIIPSSTRNTSAGLTQQIRQASSMDAMAQLLGVGETFREASPKTKRRWGRKAKQRQLELAE